MIVPTPTGDVPTPTAIRSSLVLLVTLVVLGTTSALLPGVALAKRSVPAVRVANAVSAQMCVNLEESWPTSASSTVSLDAAAIRAQFDTNRFPEPEAGLEPFASARAYDNLAPVDTAVTWDSNGDDRLVLECRGATGPLIYTFSVVVERRLVCDHLVRGQALFCGGDLLSNGGGNNPKITIEVPPPFGIVPTVRVAGTIDDPSIAAVPIAQVSGAAAGTIANAGPFSSVGDLEAAAQEHHRYFTSIVAAESSPVDPVWAPTGGTSGLCVLELPTGSTYALPATGRNTQSSPGVFVLLDSGRCNGVTLSIRGTADYCGIVYVEGPASLTHGTARVCGSLVAGGTVDMRSTVGIAYNDTAVTTTARYVDVAPLWETKDLIY